jgi:hypothetical protein
VQYNSVECFIVSQQAVADLDMMRKIAEQQQNTREVASVRDNGKSRRDKQVG